MKKKSVEETEKKFPVLQWLRSTTASLTNSMKLSSGLSDEKFLKMFGITISNNGSTPPDNNANVKNCINSDKPDRDNA